MSNNKTVKNFNINIKLRGDNVYDLYINNKWISSNGSYEKVVDDVRNEMHKSLIGD